MPQFIKLLILKASIMTRIQGCGFPLGKKKLYSDSHWWKVSLYSGRFLLLVKSYRITQLKREYSYNKTYLLYDAYMKLESLMSRACTIS
uniref:hypothetical protein n=1 Tax=Cylindrospermopsis raciborskii TaxID=77022 RepID=UPI001F37BBEE|nr:hypothetical protein [Cylindrospermopsis raciborskii]